MLVERSYIGQAYLLNFRRAAQHEGIQIVAEEYIAQTGQDIEAAVRTLHDSGAEAIVHCGFGLGVAEINDALRALDWDPPRYMAGLPRRRDVTTVRFDGCYDQLGNLRHEPSCSRITTSHAGRTLR